MNDPWTTLPLGPSAPVAELLLAGTAIRIELPPSKHDLAVARYEALRKQIERTGSPLCGLVTIFYPQGSMAIRATISSRKRSEGFDIDIIAELKLPHSTKPAEVLDLLFTAIKGVPGSQYHDMVERQTRCVTVNYADGMHLDITPTLLRDECTPRLSHLFHAKPEEPPANHRALLMNSFAFCAWFNGKMAIDIEFAEAYSAHSKEFFARDADVVQVPEHSTKEGGKSAAVIALQLLKRNRNLRYAKRTGCRMPPSVMMAKIAGETTVPPASISGALNAITNALLKALETAEQGDVLIDVRNPTCEEDKFTDRWPENRDAQRLYIRDLKEFRKQLEALLSEAFMLDQKQDLLVEMFGEGPAKSTVEEFVESIGKAVKSGDRTFNQIGRVIPFAVTAAPALVKAAPAQPPKHTFFGSKWKKP